MITAYQSDKIKVLSFIAIILVLYIHSGFHSFEIEEMNLNNDIQHIISGLLGRCAVPFFFIISGYLFFQKTSGFSSIFNKIRKRFKTLLIPYLIGCMFMALFISIICLIPLAKPYLNNPELTIYRGNLLNIIKNIFWDSGNGSPFAFHLWYIKDLFIIVLFSPLIYTAILHLKYYFLLIIWITVFLCPNFNILTSTLWFCIGALLALYPPLINYYKNRQITLVSILVFIIASIIDFYSNNLLLIQAKTFIICFGILGLWGVYDYLVPNNFSLEKNQYLSIACQYTFFIYLFHEPTINIFRKLIVAIIGKSSIGYLISYLLSPWITLYILIIIGIYFKKLFPQFYYICTGNR